jgi:hypothetical protein
MAGLVPILVVFLAIAVVFLAMQVRQVGVARDALKHIEAQRDEKRSEAEAAKLEARERSKELERVRDELHDTRAKLKKKSEQAAVASGTAKERPAKTKGLPPTAPAVGDSGSVAAAVVRITNQELEEQHRAAEELLRTQLAEAESRIAELARREAEREAALEKAKRSLADAAPKAPVVTEGQRPEEQVQALKVQLEAIERAAAERERQLKKELDKTAVDLRAAEKRASQNQQLYQVAKGQLVVVEDRLAALKRKHEKVIAPEDLKRAEAPVVHAEPAQAEAVAAEPAQAEAVAAEPAVVAPAEAPAVDAQAAEASA